MEKKRKRASPGKGCRCDGTWNCFECPYPDYYIRSDYATRGGIGDDIAAALEDDRPTTQTLAERDPEHYRAMLKKQLERQNKRRAANKAKYGAEQRLIRECRKARGWKQQDLAVRCGVSEHTVSCWECGTVPARWELVEKAMPEIKQKRLELSETEDEKQ